jgi:hypothetical protein
MAKKVDPRLSHILSALREEGATPKALMEAAIAITDLAGEVCTHDQLEYLDLDAIQDPITEFLSNLEILNEQEAD